MAELGETLAGPQLPPQRSDVPEGKGFSEQKKTIKQLLQTPEMIAFLLQASTSMLSGAGIGQAFGEAGQAVGRMGEGKAKEKQEQRRQYESDREYQLRLMQMQKSGAGGGGGGGGSGSTDSAGFMKPDKLAKMLYDDDLAAWEAEQESLEPGVAGRERPDRLSYEITARMVNDAIANGMPLQYYSELRRSGGYQQADQLARTFVNDPNEGRKIIENFENPTGASVAPDTSYTPGAPAPAAPSPAMPSVPSLTGFGGVGQGPTMVPPTTVPPVGAIPEKDILTDLARSLGF